MAGPQTLLRLLRQIFFSLLHPEQAFSSWPPSSEGWVVPPLLPKLQERCSLCCHRKNLIDHSLKGANCPCLRNQLPALLLLLTSLCFHTAEKHFLVLLSDCTSASSLIGFCVHIQQGTNVLRAGEKQQHLFSIQSLRAAPQELFFPLRSS